MKLFIIYFVCISFAYGQFSDTYHPTNLIQPNWINSNRGVVYRRAQNWSSPPYYGVAVPGRGHPGLPDHTHGPFPSQKPNGGVLVQIPSWNQSAILPPQRGSPRQPHSLGYLQQCRRSDPNIEKCILDRIEATRVRPSPRDPFKVNTLYAISSMNGAKVHTALKNVVAHGGSDYRITNLKVNLHNPQRYDGELTLTYPQLNVTAFYYKRGTKIFYGNFQTHGKFVGFLKNIVAVFKISAIPITKRLGGEEYLKLDSVMVDVSIGQGDLNLTPYDRTDIGRKIATYAKTDPYGSMQKEVPAINEVVSRMFKQYMNEALDTMPLRNMLVD